MKLRHLGLHSLSGFGGVRRERGGGPATALIDQEEAVVEGVLTVEGLEGLETNGVVLGRDRPAGPGVVLKGNREGIRCRGANAGGGLADGGGHGTTLPEVGGW